MFIDINSLLTSDENSFIVMSTDIIYFSLGPSAKEIQIHMKSKPLPPVYKTKEMFALEQAHGGRDIREILVEKYNELGSQYAVAKALNVSQPTIDNWFERLGIVVTVARSVAVIGEPPNLQVA